ncbi:BREX-2 system ATPase PglY [Streptomyces clavifer]|uniref:BREX-2 system ATPase PglY n=1 Tax=Streptomyces clavifer TaxID=68188 RepID=UPI0034027ED3
MAANPANNGNGTPLLRDLIKIKPEVSSSDFVLQLADATTPEGAGKALDDYVVTDDLVQHFNEALGLIKSAVDSHSSKAAYLHASFGAGKSHFMAVLHALLNHAPAARNKTDFDPVFAKNGWLQDGDRRFLMVPVHMLDAKSMEQRILGGYVKRIRELRPDASTPRVYRTDAMFRDLQSMRDRLGDEDVIKFLAGATADGTDGANGTEGVDATAETSGEWGEFGAAFAWTTDLLNEAMAAGELEVGQKFNAADPSTPAELRARLAQDAAKMLPGYEERAVEQDGGFISLDRGLSVIAQHAKSLNFDGIVLFLDELILWFASRISSSEFVSRETAKITNLVESGDERRAVPVVSFIARQRDLRDLVGSAEDGGRYQRAIVDNLELASGRFDRISLEDRNLPQIAHARLLKPVSTEADAVIGEAFKKAKATNAKFWDELLGGDGNNIGGTETAFRFTYPFSPAFMDTLVHLSSALQRSRTGLKLMGELLANRRHLLRVGELVPLGDIYGLISGGGDKPFTDELRAVFDEANRLYTNRMRPYLLDQYRVTEEQVTTYQADPAAIEDADLSRRLKQFTDDNRLMSTLVLSALAPAAPAFQNMTVKRLLALNAGTIKALLPGGEIPALINKLKEWAGRIPEIKLAGDGAAMTVRLELTGVDIDSVVRNGRDAFDKPRYRHDAAVELLRSEFGLTAAKGQGGFDAYDTLDFTWRGSKRRTEVVFASIADREETPDSTLTPADPETWRLVADLPWDEGEFGPREDLNRMNNFWERHPEVQHSLAWVPSHMTTTMYADFNRYVIIKRILNSGSDFDGRFAAHLGPDDRIRARGLLTTQAETLRDRVLAAFKQAYGLAKKQEGDVLDDFSNHIATKPGATTPGISLAATPRDAIRDIAGKMLAWQYPAHPDLGAQAVTPTQARTVLGYIGEAAGSREGKAEIARGDQGLMRTVAKPLKLGTMGESYFTLGSYWRDHFNRLAKNDPDGEISYSSLITWMDEPQRMGLQSHIQQLVAAAYGEMEDRVWVIGGTPVVDLKPGEIKDGWVLRRQPRPSEADWETARTRFEKIFGAKAPVQLRGPILNSFAELVRTHVDRLLPSNQELVAELERRADFLGLDDTATDGRLHTARRGLALLDELLAAKGRGAKRVVEAFAGFGLGELTPERIGSSVTTAEAVAAALKNAAWDVLGLGTGMDALATLQEDAREDQFSKKLQDSLPRAQRAITQALAVQRQQQQRIDPPAPGPVLPAPAPSDPNQVPLNTGTSHPRVETTARTGSVQGSASEVEQTLHRVADAHPGKTIEITWKVVD